LYYLFPYSYGFPSLWKDIWRFLIIFLQRINIALNVVRMKPQTLQWVINSHIHSHCTKIHFFLLTCVFFSLCKCVCECVCVCVCVCVGVWVCVFCNLEKGKKVWLLKPLYRARRFNQYIFLFLTPNGQFNNQYVGC
jgi:hypothetical protein